MQVDLERIVDALDQYPDDPQKFCQVWPQVKKLIDQLNELLAGTLPPKYGIPVTLAISTLEAALQAADVAICAGGQHPVGSLWGGYFAFQNGLGGDIETGWAKHWTTDWGEEKIVLDGLGKGDQSLSQQFKTSTSNKDRWAFYAKLTDGTEYSVAEKQCGYESSDAGKTVILQPIVSGSSRTFNVIMPESSSCDMSF